MIINESTNLNDDYVEIKVKDPKKFISAMDGIMDNGLQESDESYEEFRKYRREANAKRIENEIRKQNKFSNPPTTQELKKSNNKIKVPWFAVGMLLQHAKNYGLEKKFDKRNNQ